MKFQNKTLSKLFENMYRSEGINLFFLEVKIIFVYCKTYKDKVV